MAIARRSGYGKKIAFGDYKNKNSVKKENKNLKKKEIFSDLIS